MSREEIRKQIYNIIRETFGNSLLSDNIIIDCDLIPDNWDKIMFILNLESIFNISIPEDDENKLLTSTIKEIVEYIDECLKEKE
jgi:acyl carrier protein